MTWSLERKIITGFGSALLILSITGWITYQSMVNYQEDAGWVEHTHQVVHSLESLFANIKDAESSRRGFLLTHEQNDLEQYRQVLPRVREEYDRLLRLTAENKYQQQKIQILKPLISRKLRSLDDSIRLVELDPANTSKQVMLTEEGKVLMDAITKEISAMKVR